MFTNTSTKQDSNRLFCIQFFFTLMLLPGLSFAHSAERGLVMLLPTGYYLSGSAFAVALTFVLISRLFHKDSRKPKTHRTTAPSNSHNNNAIFSAIGFAVTLVLLMCGIWGSTDPLRNPLPLFVWTFFWIAFPLIQFIVGDLWQLFNPWSWILKIYRHTLSKKHTGFDLSDNQGYVIAIVQFFAFAWFELIYPASEDPGKLVIAISLYWFFNFAGGALVGEKKWLGTAEPFSIFFRLVGACSPLQWQKISTRKSTCKLVWPGAQLLRQPALPVAGVLFVLLTLSTVSFDGFSKTFLWLGFLNINPLEYPGRSALIYQNSAGLLIAFVTLWLVFIGCSYLGIKALQKSGALKPHQTLDSFCGRLIYSIIPISLVFHFAHYLSALLVNIQYLMLALNDPLGSGWSLFGLGERHYVTTSFLNDYHRVSWIWTTQTLVITLGHIMAVILAHNIARSWLNNCESDRAVSRTQFALTTFMVGYTVFGLWLLSTASMG